MATEKESVEIEVDEKHLSKLNIEKTNLTALKSEIETDKELFTDKKIKEFEDWMLKLPERKAKKGNQTMREYLTSLKDEANLDKEKFADKFILKLDSSIVGITKELSEVSKLQQK